MTPILSRIVLLLLQCYRWCISPLFPPACRYDPTCSCYAMQAIARHGVWRGGVLAARRLASCHPWGGSGEDPVPGTENARVAAAAAPPSLPPS